ncbi:MAG: hypothetical protein GYA34_14120 [Chloroflexi bacterium]|nr:hypothetical protein [Chloroflexota bacterium]
MATLIVSPSIIQVTAAPMRSLGGMQIDVSFAIIDRLGLSSVWRHCYWVSWYGWVNSLVTLPW